MNGSVKQYLVVRLVGNETTHRTVGEVNLNKVVLVSSQTSIFDACKHMAEKNVDSVLVVDKSGDGAKPEFLVRPLIKGILTSKDIVLKVISQDVDLKKTPVSSVMTSPVRTIESDASLYKVASFMNKNDFRQMPVVSPEEIRGMATSSRVNMVILESIITDIKLMASLFR
ncbi:MAG: CBS domain-containing protein [Candidatus Altiarchaeales archaeon]|nr:CBS domain-containing protein [Candidatus Altiarchaeales archaeon]MBD3416048.1 CBS domain-containing protein [Candidatus Altiarchaeales archaeon]